MKCRNGSRKLTHISKINLLFYVSIRFGELCHLHQPIKISVRKTSPGNYFTTILSWIDSESMVITASPDNTTKLNKN